LCDVKDPTFPRQVNYICRGITKHLINQDDKAPGVTERHSQGQIATGPRQHRHSWFRVMTIFNSHGNGKVTMELV
jgi:hypothetical protein